MVTQAMVVTAATAVRPMAGIAASTGKAKFAKLAVKVALEAQPMAALEAQPMAALEAQPMAALEVKADMLGPQTEVLGVTAV